MSRNEDRPKYYKPVAKEERKSNAGRPPKYNRRTVVDENGKEEIVLELIDKKRYFFVAYNWTYMNTIKWGYITFEMSKDKMFSIGDLQRVTGLQSVVPFNWIEFLNKKDFIEFQGKNYVEFETLTDEK